MAYDIFISAHGGRGDGTSKGTYVVPAGVRIHVFTGDDVLLKGAAGMNMEDMLTLPGYDLGKVKASVSKVYEEYETVPNYTATGSYSGDPAFQFDTGVYYVGSQKHGAPALPMGNGQNIRLGDIISLFRKTFPGLVDVYWLCCRAAPQNSNNNTYESVDSFGIVQRPKSMGLTPSEVVKRGGKWR
ncbi:hypothetical protein L4D20_15245 [Vibrio kyushuensis]|uniref:putative adhesin n=1 Tax=Vibrio kyushuensis TaxID=2910249 RepID=UPI003D0B7C2F